MTEKINTVCDKCGLIQGYPFDSSLGWMCIRVRYPKFLFENTKDIDLCKLCYKDFKKWLKQERKNE